LLLVSSHLSLVPAYADVIYFQSGETVKGYIVEEHRDRVIMSTLEGERIVLRAQIDEIFYDDPERNYLYLATQALERGEFTLAKGFLQKALQIQPRFQEALDALGRLEDLQKKAASAWSNPHPLEALEEHWGLTLESTTPWPLVKAVREDSLAARVGIQVEDLLIRAWGDSLAYLPLEEVAGILLGPPETTVKLTLQRRITLPKESLEGKKWPGMTLGMEWLGLFVLMVEPGGVSALSGIRPQDRIMVIGDASTRYLVLGEARRILQEAGKGGMTLGIHRDLMIKRE